MWRPSKKTLFILMLSMAILGTISFTMIDWDEFNSGILGAIRELGTTLIFFGVGLNFIFPYVRSLKKDANK